MSSSNQPLLPDKDKKKTDDAEPSANADEIDIDDDEDEAEPVNIAKQTVPSAVFGKLDKDNE